MSRHRVFPLSMEEILDDSLFDPPGYYPNNSEYDDKSYPLLLAPPSTPTNGLDYNDSDDQVRWGSFSSNGSSPSMVEDHSGISDSDPEPQIDDLSPKTTTFLWNRYEKLWGVKEEEVPIVHRRQGIPEDFISPSTRSSGHPSGTLELPKLKPTTFPGGGKLIPVSTSIVSAPVMDDSPPNLRRSDAQRYPRRIPTTTKKLPLPPKREPPPQRPLPKKPRSQSECKRLPTHREHPIYMDSPYRIHPSANPCNSSQLFSFHNTPPLPYVAPIEKSVFECDSDDERQSKLATRSPSTFASKLHFRSVSLGNKRFGFMPNKEGDKENNEGRGRRRSATDIVRGMFGMRKN